MTVEEARQNIILQADLMCENCSIHNIMLCVDWCDDREALEIAAKALKKQDALKPDVPFTVDGRKNITGFCPTCGRRQSYNSREWHKEFNKWCTECGQRLNWSENDG